MDSGEVCGEVCDRVCDKVRCEVSDGDRDVAPKKGLLKKEKQLSKTREKRTKRNIVVMTIVMLNKL